MSTSLAIRCASASTLLAALLLVSPWGGIALGEEASSAARNAAELVQAALRSELGGPSEVRGQLLAEALQRDPDYAPARWHSGYVKFDGRWLKIDEVPRHARANESLTEYRKLRDAMIDTADNHRELARWCHKRKLLDEERVHWAKVLEFERHDEEAIAGLGLTLFNGRLLTRLQLDAEKARVVEAERAFREFQPKLLKWRRAIEQGTPKQFDEAMRGMQSLDNPAAIPALDLVFDLPRKAKKSDELNTLAVSTLGRFPQQLATDLLLRRAVTSDSQDVRSAAAAELKKRPMYSYVPKLIAALPGKYHTRYDILVLPDGAISHQHQIYWEGNQIDFSFNYDAFYMGIDQGNILPTQHDMLPTAGQLSGTSAALESHAQKINQQSDALRKRLQSVLVETTGFENVDHPKLWERQYDSYYGWSTPTEPKPLIQASATSIYAEQEIIPVGHSCFPAGTPVKTIFGSMPIEKIVTGDRVLTQNVSTGELRFKPVQKVTLRVATGLVKISLGSQSILTTPGHPFWIAGQGWNTARHLRPGDIAHGLNGGNLVGDVSEQQPAEVYNLVVSEDHNYFVGDTGLLVHDNTPLELPAQPVPGLAIAPNHARK